MAEWTDERFQLAVKLWNDGLSATEVAKKLGDISRNAVIGKVNRAKARGLITRAPASKLEIGQRAAKARNANRVPSTKVRKQSRVQLRSPDRALPAAPLMADLTHAKPWTDREAGECAYPISGTGADALSCCAASGEARYCPDHAERMFVKPERAIGHLIKWAVRYAA